MLVFLIRRQVFDGSFKTVQRIDFACVFRAMLNTDSGGR
ncbi:MAG: hypothetical protein ACJA2B_000902 [Candidatus Endobugula sp.]|jgi:hypothetical protein